MIFYKYSFLYSLEVILTSRNKFQIPYTGSSMNPARSFGIAPFAVNAWENHWVCIYNIDFLLKYEHIFPFLFYIICYDLRSIYRFIG